VNETSLIQTLSIWVLPVLLAITVHEAAHGYVANMLGDKTALMLGRLTLNPIKHIDPISTIILPLVLVMLGGVVFGYAKPVPVDPRNFKKPREHMAIVAAAGPLSNLGMAIGWALLLGLALHGLNQTWIGYPLSMMAQAGITINLILMLLNFIPIPPLDGGRVLSGFLGPMAALKFSRIEPYGLFILLLLLFTGILGKTLWPIEQWLQGLLIGLVV